MYCNYQLLGERRDISDKAVTAAVCTAITQSIIAREIHKVHPLLSAQHSHRQSPPSYHCALSARDLLRHSKHCLFCVDLALCHRTCY